MEEFIFIYIVGLFISVIILIFMFAIVIGMKRWTAKRDKYYTEVHNELKGQIKETQDLIKGNVADVLDSVKDIINKVNK